MSLRDHWVHHSVTSMDRVNESSPISSNWISGHLEPSSSESQHRVRVSGKLRRPPRAAWLRLSRHFSLDIVLEKHNRPSSSVGRSFSDQLAAARNHFDQLNASLGRQPISSKLLFHGPHTFEQLADSAEVDLIQISTPPFFHVQHLDTAVACRSTVYCEKPIGIDVIQAQKALQIAKRVKPTQSIDVGFQCRSAPPIAAIAQKIQNGALGKIAALAANYNAPASKEKIRPGASADELRLRNWLWDRALSGDILVEQNIHIIDLCNWILGDHPVKAVATGGRNILEHSGDCWDNYQVDFVYPGDVHLSFSSTQFGDYGGFDAGIRMFGAEGSAAIAYSGPIQILGAHAWSSQDSLVSTGPGKFDANGSFSDNLAFADRDKDRTFIESIISDPTHNQIAAGVERPHLAVCWAVWQDTSDVRSLGRTFCSTVRHTNSVWISMNSPESTRSEVEDQAQLEAESRQDSRIKALTYPLWFEMNGSLGKPGTPPERWSAQ